VTDEEKLSRRGRRKGEDINHRGHLRSTKNKTVMLSPVVKSSTVRMQADILTIFPASFVDLWITVSLSGLR